MPPVIPPPGVDLPATFGDIDIYLFDQLLRGRFDRRPRVLDAGCGDGRNLMYLLRRGFTCFGIDRDPAAIERVRGFAAQLAPDLPLQNFCTGEIDHLPWPEGSMDAVVSSASAATPRWMRPSSAMRPALSRSPRGTPGTSPYHASRSRKLSLAFSTTVWM